MQLCHFPVAILGLATLSACTEAATDPVRVPAAMTIALDTAAVGTEMTSGLVVRDRSGMLIDLGSLVSSIALKSYDTTTTTVDVASLKITPIRIDETDVTAH